MDDDKPQHSGLPSWTTMLVLLFLAIFAAIGIAYWALYPFFHRH